MALTALAVKKPRSKNLAVLTTVCCDGIHVGQFYMSHALALDMYDRFLGATPPAFMPKNIEEPDWEATLCQ